MFFTKDDVKVNYIESLANQIKDRMLTFKVNGTDEWTSKLAMKLFEEELDDQIIITDMSIPKGYK